MLGPERSLEQMVYQVGGHTLPVTREEEINSSPRKNSSTYCSSDMAAGPC